jgi:PAS domain-containing protein
MRLNVDSDPGKRAQEALAESERTVRGIIDTALDAFVQMDEAGKIVDWNPQAEDGRGARPSGRSSAT